jgi:hypothetical protein
MHVLLNRRIDIVSHRGKHQLERLCIEFCQSHLWLVAKHAVMGLPLYPDPHGLPAFTQANPRGIGLVRLFIPKKQLRAKLAKNEKVATDI